MLPERVSQLLTAYVDGEVSARQRQAVEQLLKQSPEAQKLHLRLREDAEKLRRLPRRCLGPDFADRVVRTVTERRLHHARRAASSARVALPAWGGIAVAAGVLFCIGIGSYLYFETAQQWEARRAARQSEKEPPAKREQIADLKVTGPEEATPSKPDRRETEEPAPPSDVAQSEPAPAPKPKGPGKDTKSLPGPATELATPNPKIERFKVVDAVVPASLTLRDLDQQKTRDRLREELRREGAFRFEIPCPSSARAIERLKAAFQAHGIHLVIDPELSARFKNRRLKTDFAIYTEGLTGEEMAKILGKIGRDDKQADAKKRGDGLFDKVLILPLTDRKELTNVLGVDPLPPPAKPKAPLGVDIRRPVADGTATQVIESLEGQRAPRPEPGKPIVKAPDRLAVVVPYANGRPRSAPSKEVRQFLDSRKERLPGTIQMFLVVNAGKG